MRVYTGGTFDLFHVGHVNLLRRCREMAGLYGKVIVGLNRDEFIVRYKGRGPVIPYGDRAAVLEACRYVDRVIPNTGDEDSKPAILVAAPDVISVGDDWAQRDYCAQMGFTPEWLAGRGIRLVYLPYTQGISTTVVRARSRAWTSTSPKP